MKIFTVIGARPQFIKAAVVSRAFKEHRPDVREIEMINSVSTEPAAPTVMP